MPFTTISRVLSYSLPQTSHWFIKKARLPSGELRLGTLVAFEAGLCGLFHQILLCFIHAFFNQFLGGCSLVRHRDCRCLACEPASLVLDPHVLLPARVPIAAGL